MKEENATSIEYFRDFRRVADLINGVIFHGKQIVRECDLQEQNPVLHDVTKKNDKVSAIENTPDLSVMDAFSIFTIFFLSGRRKGSGL